MTELPTPKAFISYSWTSEEYKDRVRALADRLINDGVNVLLDQYDLREGDDTYAYMERMVTDSSVNKVLVICNRAYMEKADERKGGVGHESTIISPQVYQQVSGEDNKFVAVIFEKDPSGKPYIHTMFASKLYIDMSNEESYAANYEQLLRFMFNKPLLKKPVLGKPPAFLLEDTRPSMETTGKAILIRDSVNRGRETTFIKGLFSDYLAALATVINSMPAAVNDGKPDDEIAVSEIWHFKDYRNEFLELLSFLGRYTDLIGLGIEETISEFLEGIANARERLARDKGMPGIVFDHIGFIVHELFLYLIAFFLKNGLWDQSLGFLSRRYFVKYWKNDTSAYESYEVFRKYLKILDEVRKARLKTRLYSHHADLMHEVADSKIVSWIDIQQADLILWLREALSGKSGWYPKTVPYWDRYEPFPIFTKAISRKYLAQVLRILGVDTLQTLKEWITKFQNSEDSSRWRFDHDTNLPHLLNLEKLGTET